MSNKNSTLTAERLRELMHYDPETGEFTRLTKSNHNGADVGECPGCIDNNGYRVIKIDRKRYLAHRLAWLYCFGSFPENHNDHIDGNKLNNRIKNLRDVTRTENNQNIRRARVDNTHGFMGVSKCKDSYHARISVVGKSIFIGAYKTPELAHEAYLTAKRELHVGCTI